MKDAHFIKIVILYLLFFSGLTHGEEHIPVQKIYYLGLDCTQIRPGEKENLFVVETYLQNYISQLAIIGCAKEVKKAITEKSKPGIFDGQYLQFHYRLGGLACYIKIPKVGLEEKLPLGYGVVFKDEKMLPQNMMAVIDICFAQIKEYILKIIEENDKRQDKQKEEFIPLTAP